MPRFALTLLIIAGASVSAQDASRPAVIKLRDQFDVEHDVGTMRGQVVVLIYGDRRGAPANKTLGEQLHIEFHPTAKGLDPTQARSAPPRPIAGAEASARAPDVQVVAVAAIGKVPDLVKSVIRGQFRKGSPDVPVWLDFDDRLKEYGFAPGVPNLVVIDAAGVARYALSGALSEKQFQELVSKIDELRRAAR